MSATSKTKLCPMMFAEDRSSREARSADEPWMPCCVGEQCAWWIKNYGTGQCAITSLADSQFNMAAIAQRQEPI